MSESRPAFRLQELRCPDSGWLEQAETPQADSYKQLNKLLFNNKFDNFIETCFEKLPCVIRHSLPSRSPSLLSLFSQKKLISICEEYDISYLNNLSARKYTENHISDVYEPPEDGVASRKQLKSLFKKDYTVQFFQPQRFSDGFHDICAGFEYLFGTLAGASAYLTPAHTQGLAPHWDDVEVFIFQTEGTKLWHLWEGPYLPEEHSNDIDRESEYLAVAPVEILLQPGDILYLPRGTIHEALSQDNFSTHVTVSVFQKNHLKGLMERLLPELLQKLFDEETSAASAMLRRGLPLSFAESLGTFAGATLCNSTERRDINASSSKFQSRKTIIANLKSVLQSLSEQLHEEDVDEAVEFFHSDFARHRLPPPVHTHKNDSKERRAFLIAQIDGSRALYSNKKSELRNAKVCICDPKLTHKCIIDENGDAVLLIGSCLDNERMCHMGHPDEVKPKLSRDLDFSDGDDSSSELTGGSASNSDIVTLSLPAHMHKIIDTLESKYRSPLTSIDEKTDPLLHFVDYQDLITVGIQHNISEDEV